MVKLFIITTSLAFLITACGGGGGGGSSSGADGVTGGSGSSGSVLTGKLVDSAVSGIRYRTATQNGVTSADGEFSYRTGETVTFSPLCQNSCHI